MTDQIYKKQVGGTHYKSMIIHPSELINRNNNDLQNQNMIIEFDQYVKEYI